MGRIYKEYDRIKWGCTRLCMICSENTCPIIANMFSKDTAESPSKDNNEEKGELYAR